MNQLVEYIASSPAIEKIEIVLGKIADVAIIDQLCRETGIKVISVRFTDTDCKQAQEENLELIIRQAKTQIYISKMEDHWETFDEHTALMFVGVTDFTTLYWLSALKPVYLIGEVTEASSTTFEIWERFRTVAQRIHLITSRFNKKDEVLDWVKNPESEIELSVIFPMYNIAQYLPKCIESVTAWKADYLEFVFVDDGSPDNCGEIVAEAAKKDSRIKLLTKMNGGCASARQYGLERAKGRYIGFIDPDDYIDPSMFRKLLRRAFVGNYEVAYSSYKERYEELHEIRNKTDVIGWPYIDGTNNREAILDLMTYMQVAIWRGIYRKDMLQANNLGFYTELRRFDDLPFKFEVYASAKSVVCVPEHLYYYRMGRPGQDISANDEKLYIHFSIFEHLDEFVHQNGSKEIIERLQIVKLATHVFALQKLLPKYLGEYIRQAKKDLLHNVGFWNTSAILHKGASKTQRAYFYAIMIRSKFLVHLLCKRNEHKNMIRERERQIQINNLEALG